MAFLDLSWQAYRPGEGFYTSEVHTHRPMPVRTFLPQGYEPRYPYPLIVFFHGEGSNEEQMLRLAPRLSRRNFISIGLRGPVPMGPAGSRLGFGWEEGPPSQDMEDYLLRAIQQTRQKYHVHSERIYLAGFAEGAAAAYRLGLALPDKFAGIISLNGTLPRQHRPLFRFPEVRGLRLFIAHGIANARIPLSLAEQDKKLLYAAGLNVTMNTYPTTGKIHPDMLRDLNRWIIDHCNEG